MIWTLVAFAFGVAALGLAAITTSLWWWLPALALQGIALALMYEHGQRS